MDSNFQTMDLDMLKPEVNLWKKLNGTQKQGENLVEAMQLTISSSKCPVHKCDGTGIILVEYPPFGYAKEYGLSHTVAHKCECSGKANIDHRRERSMLPPQYLNKKAKDFNWEIYKQQGGFDINPQKKMVNLFITQFTEFEKAGKGIFLYSKAKGSGKTLLSCIIANELIERYSLSVKFTSVIDLLEMVKKNYKNGDYNEDIDSFFKSRLLILDDIGTECKTDHTDMILYRLINERCNNRLTTVFTSNLSIDQLKIDERTVDRINKMAISIDIPNVCVRKIKAEEEKIDFLSKLHVKNE